MPELPEVEFCARRLRAWLVGRRVAGVGACAGTPLRDIEKPEFEARLVGRTPTGVRRRGKQLLIDLDDGQVWLVHLGMTGKFLLDEPTPRPGTRVRLDLAGGARLDFVDVRRFGRLRLLSPGESHPELDRLGPDALELAGAPAAFATRLGRTSRAVKVALLDQAFLAGVGNIYAAEALHAARIDPRVPASKLTSAELRRLAGAVLDAFEASLEREDGPEIVYLPEAKATNPFRVYGRAGAPCPECGAPIQRIEQAGRATFWVPEWQDRPRLATARRRRR